MIEIELEDGELIKRVAEPYDAYYVTSYGRVFSTKGTKVRELKLFIIGGGYSAVGLCVPGVVQKTHPVHRLVAEAFIGKPDSKCEIRHLDGDPLNSHLDNLKYGTRSENQRDRLAHGRSNFAKLTWKEVKKIRKEYEVRGTLQSELAEAFSVTQQTISRIVNNKIWIEL